jgi:hypothetical protein
MGGFFFFVSDCVFLLFLPEQQTDQKKTAGQIHSSTEFVIDILLLQQQNRIFWNMDEIL